MDRSTYQQLIFLWIMAKFAMRNFRKHHIGSPSPPCQSEVTALARHQLLQLNACLPLPCRAFLLLACCFTSHGWLLPQNEWVTCSDRLSDRMGEHLLGVRQGLRLGVSVPLPCRLGGLSKTAPPQSISGLANHHFCARKNDCNSQRIAAKLFNRQVTQPEKKTPAATPPSCHVKPDVQTTARTRCSSLPVLLTGLLSLHPPGPDSVLPAAFGVPAQAA